MVVLGQRGGPSTGMPTWAGQGDLNLAVFAGQGEFPRIVLAPGDLGECRRLGKKAFEWAEKYQVPVILLTDKYLAETRFTEEKREEVGDEENKIEKNLKEKGNYQRYALTETGISPRLNLGEAVFLTNSYEHDEAGFTSEDRENRERMMEKRMRKLVGLEGGVEFEGEEGKGRTILVGWGSTKGIIGNFWQKHQDLSFLHFWRVWPFPEEAKRILEEAGRVIVIEENWSGQLAGLIEREILREVERITKDNGRPFFKEELERRLEKIL